VGSHKNFGAFQDRLREYGHAPGQNITIEARIVAGSDTEPLGATIAALVSLPVDLIVLGSGLPAARAAREVTNTTPIVLTVGGDPVEGGLGRQPGSAGRPHHRAHDHLLSTQRQAAGAVRAGRSWRWADRRPLERRQSGQGTRVPRDRDRRAKSGIQLQPLEVRGPEDFESAFEAATRERPEALIVLHDGVTAAARHRIFEFAARTHLPAMYEFRDWTEAGGLMSYAPNRAEMGRRAAYYVVRIVNGTKPADLLVEQPREFDFVINLRTAQALGLTVPQHVLLQATEAIQ
jgi:putative ABC transport system substrate-binding protein